MLKSITLHEITTQAKKTIQIGLPLIVAQLAQMSMGFVDTLMAGRLSAMDLAAVAVGWSFFVPMLVFSMGVILMINPIVAQLHGARNYEPIGQNLWQALWLSQILGLACFFALQNSVPLLHLLNIQPEIIPVTDGYLKAISWGTLPYFAFFALRFFNEGLTVTKPSMYIAFFGTVVNAIANYVFMYGHLGAPAMGAVGCGWASTVVWWLMMFGIAGFTLGNRKFEAFKIPAGIALPKWRFFKEILKIGVPNGINSGIEVSMFALAALVIGSLGVSVVAAHQVAINVAAMTFMIPLALSNATSAGVGFAVGQKNFKQAFLIGYVGIGVSLLLALVTCLLLFFFPDFIAGIYTRDSGVKEIVVKLLFLTAILHVVDGIQVASIGALRGLKDTKVPMIANVISYWIIGLPLGYLLAKPFAHGVEGMWIGLIAGLTVAAILHTWRFYLLTKKQQFHSLTVTGEVFSQS